MGGCSSVKAVGEVLKCYATKSQFECTFAHTLLLTLIRYAHFKCVYKYTHFKQTVYTHIHTETHTGSMKRGGQSSRGFLSGSG